MRRLVVAVAVVVAIGSGLVLTSQRSSPVGQRLLPDLWSSAPFELQLSTLEGRNVLRFTTEINNQGNGPFMLRGSTRDGRFAQWIAMSTSGHAEEPVDVVAVWGGDTHFHWHIEDVARYWIEPVGAEPLDDRFDNKVGFCFFDGVNRMTGDAAAPTKPVHPAAGCGSRLDPDLEMGLSVGWGDQYRFDLRGQYIDIHDLPSGSYRLVAEVDPDGLFIEADTSNNRSATDFTLIVDTEGLPALLR